MLACRYEVFLDLSVPLTKEGKGGMLNFFSKNSTPSIEDCLHAFTTDEVMQVQFAWHALVIPVHHQLYIKCCQT